MRSLPRVLAATAAAVTLSLVAGACDTSPVAASVDGQYIKVTALNAELAALSANPRYITAVEQSAGRISNAKGTYTTGWTAHVLTQQITAAAVRRHLARHHDLPGPAMLTAARTVEAADYSNLTLWSSFSAGYRDELTQRTADLATLEPPAAPASQIRAAYKQFANYFYSRVCVRAASVPASTPSGGLDYPAALAELQRLERTHQLQGTVTCYTPAELDAQPGSFAKTVIALGVGAAASPQRTSLGYQTTEVVSRTPIPLAGPLRRALSVAIDLNTPSPVLGRVMAAARVHVDPAYGTWSGSVDTGFAVHPPAPPATSGA